MTFCIDNQLLHRVYK